MLFLCVIIVHVLCTVHGCFVSKDDIKTSTVEQRFNLMDIVVFGKDIDHVVRKSGSMDFTDSVFQIYCILKGNKTLPENITIDGISPRTECSGTYMYMMRKTSTSMDPGLEMIVGLRRLSSGNYEWHEINKMESSAFEPTDDNWQTVSKVLSPSTWMPPKMSTTEGCPIKYVTKPAISNPPVESEPKPPVESEPRPGEQQSQEDGKNSASSVTIPFLHSLMAVCFLLCYS